MQFCFKKKVKSLNFRVKLWAGEEGVKRKQKANWELKMKMWTTSIDVRYFFSVCSTSHKHRLWNIAQKLLTTFSRRLAARERYGSAHTRNWEMQSTKFERIAWWNLEKSNKKRVEQRSSVRTAATLRRVNSSTVTGCGQEFHFVNWGHTNEPVRATQSTWGDNYSTSTSIDRFSAIASRA